MGVFYGQPSGELVRETPGITQTDEIAERVKCVPGQSGISLLIDVWARRDSFIKLSKINVLDLQTDRANIPDRCRVRQRTLTRIEDPFHKG